ncbi:MAG: hypothetical protein GY845_01720, partial [Planctomycetes bacterium]|nr:hypothetical protein [Planctomycetota bacterium]
MRLRIIIDDTVTSSPARLQMSIDPGDEAAIYDIDKDTVSYDIIFYQYVDSMGTEIFFDPNCLASQDMNKKRFFSYV